MSENCSIASTGSGTDLAHCRQRHIAIDNVATMLDTLQFDQMDDIAEESLYQFNQALAPGVVWREAHACNAALALAEHVAAAVGTVQAAADIKENERAEVEASICHLHIVLQPDANVHTIGAIEDALTTPNISPSKIAKFLHKTVTNAVKVKQR